MGAQGDTCEVRSSILYEWLYKNLVGERMERSSRLGEVFMTNKKVVAPQNQEQH